MAVFIPQRQVPNAKYVKICVCVNVVCRAVLDLDWTRVDAEPPTLTTADTYYLCFSD